MDAGIGTLIGLAVGWLIIRGARRTRDELAETLLILAAPYAAWMLAETLHVSAVLACVAGGLYTRQHLSTAVGPKSRLQSNAVWDVLVFVLNAMIFVLLGMQFAKLLRTSEAAELPELLMPGLVISIVVIVVRLLWVPIATYLPRWLDRSIARRDPRHRCGRWCWWPGRACVASCRWPRRWLSRSRWPMAVRSRFASNCCT